MESRAHGRFFILVVALCGMTALVVALVFGTSWLDLHPATIAPDWRTADQSPSEAKGRHADSGDASTLSAQELDQARQRIAALEAEVASLQAKLAEQEQGAARAQAERDASAADAAAAANAPPLPEDPEALVALLTSAMKSGDAETVKRAGFALFLRMKARQPGVLDALLAAVASDPSEQLLGHLARLLANPEIELSTEELAMVRDAMLDTTLASTDANARREAMRALDGVLKRAGESAAALTDPQVQELIDRIIKPGNFDDRVALMGMLARYEARDPRFFEGMSSVAQGDEDPMMRARAIQNLRASELEGATDLILGVLARDVDPAVLWEAASAANFLTQSAASTAAFKRAYRDLMHREVSDLARGRAAQSLALLATLDGDTEVAGELRYLAGSTADPLLAEFARTAAAQLESGEASIRSIAQAWTSWHETLDRGRYP